MQANSNLKSMSKELERKERENIKLKQNVRDLEQRVVKDAAEKAHARAEVRQLISEAALTEIHHKTQNESRDHYLSTVRDHHAEMMRVKNEKIADLKHGVTVYESTLKTRDKELAEERSNSKMIQANCEKMVQEMRNECAADLARRTKTFNEELAKITAKFEARSGPNNVVVEEQKTIIRQLKSKNANMSSNIKRLEDMNAALLAAQREYNGGFEHSEMQAAATSPEMESKCSRTKMYMRPIGERRKFAELQRARALKNRPASATVPHAKATLPSATVPRAKATLSSATVPHAKATLPSATVPRAEANVTNTLQDDKHKDPRHTSGHKSKYKFGNPAIDSIGFHSYTDDEIALHERLSAKHANLLSLLGTFCKKPVACPNPRCPRIHCVETGYPKSWNGGNNQDDNTKLLQTEFHILRKFLGCPLSRDFDPNRPALDKKTHNERSNMRNTGRQPFTQGYSPYGSHQPTQVYSPYGGQPFTQGYSPYGSHQPTQVYSPYGGQPFTQGYSPYGSHQPTQVYSPYGGQPFKQGHNGNFTNRTTGRQPPKQGHNGNFTNRTTGRQPPKQGHNGNVTNRTTGRQPPKQGHNGNFTNRTTGRQPPKQGHNGNVTNRTTDRRPSKQGYSQYGSRQGHSAGSASSSHGGYQGSTSTPKVQEHKHHIGYRQHYR